MTSNQIAWWNIQENIRSHKQNELNERNKNSITDTLGNEQNRINANRMENDFVLGQQGNAINQMQADTASRRATQDYDVGLKNVENVKTRNRQDYEIGTTANKIKSTDVSNNFIIGTTANRNQSTRNAQDFAIGKMQQESNRRQADAAVLTAGTKLAQLNPGQIVVAVTAPTIQKAAPKVVKKVVSKAQANKGKLTAPQKPVVVKAPLKGQVAAPRVSPATPSSNTKKKDTTTKVSTKARPILKGRHR